MNLSRLLAWLLILVIALGIAVSMLPRETSIPGSQLMYPNLETFVSKFKECVNETRVYPDVNALNLYVDLDEKEIKPGGVISTNESLFPLLRGDYGYVDPVLYYKLLATYLALFPVELNVPGRSYVIAPLPHSETQDEKWVDNRTVCVIFPWLHLNPVSFLPLYHDSVIALEQVSSPIGVLYTFRLALTYLPSFMFNYAYRIESLDRTYIVLEVYDLARYTGTNPVFKLGDKTIKGSRFVVRIPAENVTLRFYAEDRIVLFNNLNSSFTYMFPLTRRVLQLDVSIFVSGGEININITPYYPPIVAGTNIHSGEYWLARAYANATAKLVESIVSLIGEYEDAYRYVLSAKLLSSTTTIEANTSNNPVLAIRDVLVLGKGSPHEKSSILSMILAELRVEHELREVISRYIGVSRETLAVYTHINDIPGLWQLPENLAKRENNRYIVLYDPWQNTVFSDFDLVENR